MKSRILGIAAALVCLASWQATAQTLSVGDNAPALEVSRWVKGEKIERLEKDQTYVVEFWATWCGPCRATIPHLTELQKEYKNKGVKFIGVSVFENDPKAVDPFVKEMGDKMEYSVAVDDVPKGVEASDGKMAKNWMTASASQGIPTAFLVKNGKILWIGHPVKLDKWLAKVVEPNYDFAKFKSEVQEESNKEKAKAKVLEAFIDKMGTLGGNPDPKKALGFINDALKESPELDEELGVAKYLFMAQAGDKGASAYGMQLVEGRLKNDAQTLNQIAWMNLSNDGGQISLPEDKRDAKFALKAAIRAKNLTSGNDRMILDTLALAYFKNGDVALALEYQEKAVKLTPTGDAAAEMKDRLEQYKKAIAAKKNP